nr:hypothetical protein [Tanacetum cinerariifolium]
MIRNKARLVAQGYTQEEEIDYDEVFAPIARIKEIRLFLAYASFKYFMVYQMDVKSTFLYEKIKEEAYVCQPSRFEDLDFPDRVYKVEKALYGLHQAPRAWYETLSTYLLDNGFQRGTINKTLFIKRFTEVKTTSTPMETQNPLLKDEDGEEVDVHVYRSIIGSLMCLTSLRPDIMFVVCACARYQVNLKFYMFMVNIVAATVHGTVFLGDFNVTDRVHMMYILNEKGGPKEDACIMSYQSQGVSVWDGAEFWSTAMAKTINGEAQLHALVDGKEIIITESIVSKDPRLEDEEDEVVHKELGDSLVRAATTTSSLDAEQDSGNISKTQSKTTPNESSSQGTNSSGSPKCQETMRDTTVQTRVLDLEKTKMTQQQEIASLKIRVKKLEKKNRLRTHRLKRLYKVGLTASAAGDIVSTASILVSTASIATTVNAATTTTNGKGKGILIELVKPMKRKDQIRLDEEAALKLQAEFDEEERLTREKAKKEKEANIALIKTWDDIQAKNDIDHQLVERIKESRKELIQEITKKQKVDDDKETVEPKQLMKIIPDKEEVAIDAIPLFVKPPKIVDWKIYKEGRKSYYQIMRADGKSQMYMIFS